MKEKKKHSLHTRLRKAKAAFLATSLTLSGILLMMLNGWLSPLHLGDWQWLHSLPIGEIGGTLFGAGLLGTLFEYSFRKDQEEATVNQFREIIKEQAPAMRDAVIEGFAIHPDDLKRVANPELLDTIASNVMALRLGDEQFAREIYADIRDQAIRAAERWHDVEVRVRLSSALERSTSGTPLFSVTVEWEYTTALSTDTRRFVCTGDREEYIELVGEAPSAMAWFMTPRPGIDVASEQNFQLLTFSADGTPLPIRRSQRKIGQTYTVKTAHLKGRPVKVRHAYQVVVPAWGHRLYLELPQPTRGFSLYVDYTDTNIADLGVVDFAANGRAAHITRLPDGVAGKSISLDAPGWLMPKTGFALTWTLNSELPQNEQSEAA